MAMNSRICRCCGEPMTERGNLGSRNPNVCASCSSMADGMDESGATVCGDPPPGKRVTHETGAENVRWPGALAPMLH